MAEIRILFKIIVQLKISPKYYLDRSLIIEKKQQCLQTEKEKWEDSHLGKKGTVMILNFRTDRSGQIVQTQIRLLLESDQGFHCLPFHLHLVEKKFYGLASLFEF